MANESTVTGTERKALFFVVVDVRCIRAFISVSGSRVYCLVGQSMSTTEPAAVPASQNSAVDMRRLIYLSKKNIESRMVGKWPTVELLVAASRRHDDRPIIDIKHQWPTLG